MKQILQQNSFMKATLSLPHDVWLLLNQLRQARYAAYRVRVREINQVIKI